MSRKKQRHIKTVINPSPKNQATNPKLTSLLTNAIKLHQEGRIDEAKREYANVLALDPNNFSCYNNLGLISYNAGQLDEAEVCFQKAYAINRDDPDVCNNFGNLCQSLGKLDQAEKYLRHALLFKPNFYAAYVNLGIILHSQGRYEESITCHQQALSINPNIGEAYLNLGNSFNKLNKWEEAVDAYQKSLALKPNHPITYNNLGAVIRTLGKLTQGELYLREALRINPEYMPAYINLGTLLTDIGKTNEAIACFERVLAVTPGRIEALSNLLFSLNYKDDITPTMMAQKCFQLGKIMEEKFLALPRKYPNHPDPQRKLRIGYVSPDFRKHALTFYFEPLMRVHNRNLLEIFCYGEVFVADEVTVQLQKLADHWRSTVGISDDDLAACIRADGIDILIDLAGHSAHNRLPAFTRRPAPIQITWLGYPNTTGLTSVDYRLVDAITDPVGLADAFASETLIRLDSGFHCYQIPAGVPEVEPPPCLTTGFITFGSFNNIAKISSATLDAWGKILTLIPNARLQLKSWIFADDGTRALLFSRLAERGVVAERVTLLPAIPSVPDHIGSYRHIDIALDTFPYNGTTTTCEALWMGVPVITYLGDAHMGRVGASLLTQVGLHELIGRNKDDYIAIAVRLANDYARLTALHHGLRTRMATSSLCDIPAFARKLETVYQNLWQRWCEQSQHKITLPHTVANSLNDSTAMLDQALQHYRAGETDIATHYCQQILQIDPNHAETLYVLATIVHAQGDNPRAIKLLGQACIINNNVHYYHSALAQILYAHGEIEPAIDHFAQALALRDDPKLRSNMLLCLYYRWSGSSSEVFAAHRQFDSLYGNHITPEMYSYSHLKDEQKKLNIGYVAANFTKGIVACAMQSIFNYFDRGQFVLYVYYVGPETAQPPAEFINNLQRLAINFRSFPTDALLVAAIRADGIDILVDLAGHGPENCLLTFAQKPAPLQMSWLYPGTTGLRAIDYRLVDFISDPLNLAEKSSTEQLLRIEGGFFCFMPVVDIPKIDYQRSSDTIIFGAFAHYLKISDAVLQTWAEIINQVPESKLLLQADLFDHQENRNSWQHRLALVGIAPARQILRGTHEEDWANYRQVDIGLDTFPYNGITSTCYALWMGIPVVTWAGDHHAARIGASIMTYAGCENLIAGTRQDYIKLAVKLAADRANLVTLRDNLRVQFARSPLCDPQRFMRYLEMAYRTIWKKLCTGQAPESLCFMKSASTPPIIKPDTLREPLRADVQRIDATTYARMAENEIGLRGKRVLEIGNSLAADFIFDVLGARQWISIDASSSRQAYHGVQVVEMSVITSAHQLTRHQILLGSIEDLPVCLAGNFDVVFSLTGFERSLRLGRALEVSATALTADGKLFAMFAPIWTAHNGHQVVNFTDRTGRVLDVATQSLIPPWSHLYWRPPQMYHHLRQYMDVASAAEIVYLIYHAPQINRLFAEDYIEYFQAAPFVGPIEKTHLINLPPEIKDLLELLYPNRHHFDCLGLKIVLSAAKLTA